MAGPAVEQAKAIAGDKLRVNLVPVPLGEGIPFFQKLSSAPVQLEDPRVVEGTGVTRLYYRIRSVLCSRSQSGGNATFTTLSRPDNGARSRPADTPGEMETTGRLLFVAVVTCYLLGRILGGAAAPAEVVIYGATVAFGLEYLVASWGGLWQRG